MEQALFFSEFNSGTVGLEVFAGLFVFICTIIGARMFLKAAFGVYTEIPQPPPKVKKKKSKKKKSVPKVEFISAEYSPYYDSVKFSLDVRVGSDKYVVPMNVDFVEYLSQVHNIPEDALKMMSEYAEVKVEKALQEARVKHESTINGYKKVINECSDLLTEEGYGDSGDGLKGQLRDLLDSIEDADPVDAQKEEVITLDNASDVHEYLLEVGLEPVCAAYRVDDDGNWVVSVPMLKIPREVSCPKRQPKVQEEVKPVPERILYEDICSALKPLGVRVALVNLHKSLHRPFTDITIEGQRDNAWASIPTVTEHVSVTDEDTQAEMEADEKYLDRLHKELERTKEQRDNYKDQMDVYQTDLSKLVSLCVDRLYKLCGTLGLFNRVQPTYDDMRLAFENINTAILNTRRNYAARIEELEQELKTCEAALDRFEAAAKERQERINELTEELNDGYAQETIQNSCRSIKRVLNNVGVELKPEHPDYGDDEKFPNYYSVVMARLAAQKIKELTKQRDETGERITELTKERDALHNEIQKRGELLRKQTTEDKKVTTCEDCKHFNGEGRPCKVSGKFANYLTCKCDRFKLKGEEEPVKDNGPFTNEGESVDEEHVLSDTKGGSIAIKKGATPGLSMLTIPLSMFSKARAEDKSTCEYVTKEELRKLLAHALYVCGHTPVEILDIVGGDADDSWTVLSTLLKGGKK